MMGTKGIVRINHLMVNSYLVADLQSAEWFIVDAGLSPGSARRIIRETKKTFGEASNPIAIVLTHGHFDHIGGLKELLKRWKVPVFAHPLEVPFLTGRADYPPPDPGVGGGFVARLCRFFPYRSSHFGSSISPLTGTDGTIPGVKGWRWIHTPGHSLGHISLFRDFDRTLLSGDAFITVKQESLISVLMQFKKVHAPPAYFTPDWNEAQRSVGILSSLEPEYAFTGHGKPMEGSALKAELRNLVRNFRRKAIPPKGRYVPSTNHGNMGARYA